MGTIYIVTSVQHMPYSGKVWLGKGLANIATLFEHLAKKFSKNVWQYSYHPNNLRGFSLDNHG